MELDDVISKLPAGVQLILPGVLENPVNYYKKYIAAPDFVPAKSLLDDVAGYFMQCFTPLDLECIEPLAGRTSDQQALFNAFRSWAKKEEELQFVTHEYCNILDRYVPEIRLDKKTSWFKENYWNNDPMLASYDEDALDTLNDELDAYVKAMPWVNIPPLNCEGKLIEIIPSWGISAVNRRHLKEHTWKICVKKKDKVLVTRDDALHTQYICPTLGVAVKQAVYLLG